jgi:hypothetical protein
MIVPWCSYYNIGDLQCIDARACAHKRTSPLKKITQISREGNYSEPDRFENQKESNHIINNSLVFPSLV